MKKMYCLLLLCLTLSVISFSQEVACKVTITDVDTMMVIVQQFDQMDTIMTTNGKFSFRKKLTTPDFFTILCIKNQQSINAIREGNERKMRDKSDGTLREFFFESGEATIQSSFAGFNTAAVNTANHTLQDKYVEFRKRFDPLIQMTRTIIDSSYVYNKTAAEKQAFAMLYERVTLLKTNVAQKFAMENTGNALGAYIFFRFGRTEDVRKLDSIYRLFSPALKSTAYLKNIKEKIKSLAALKMGEPVPEFIYTTLNNTPLSIASLKGKYIVLDFWGSWCTPCIGGFPKMKEYYTKYNSKIEFIGIACRDTDDGWKEAIRKYDLKWQHVFNNKDVDDLPAKYNVEAYPTKVLIDANGKFIQSFTGEGPAFYQKLDAIFQPGAK